MDAYRLDDLFRRYLQYCSVIRNYSEVTLEGYRRVWSLFVKESAVQYPNDLSKHVFETWFFNGRLNRKWSSVTFRHYHKYLNTFLSWLFKEGYIPENFIVNLEKPKLEQRLPRTLSREESQLVLDASYHMSYAYTFERYRNRAIVGVMLFAGLRRGEVINLKLNDVSIENHSIFINQGKGAKDRVVPISNTLGNILSEYLKDRRRLNKHSLYFFTAVQKDEPLGFRCINNIMTRLRKKTRLKFSSHTLRHAFARLMLEGGCDIYTLSKIMGHSKITTTTIYLSCSTQQMSKSIEMHSLN